MSKNVHVARSKNGDQWSVKSEKSKKAFKNFDTQKQAISAARKIAIKNQSELLIHGENGKIREKNSYGNDKFPPKG